LKAKAAKKRKLIEAEEAKRTDADDEERFESMAGSSTVHVKTEPRQAVTIEEGAIPRYEEPFAGWRGDTELMQLYDPPETIPKCEPHNGDSRIDKGVAVYGAPGTEHKHEPYGSTSDSSDQRKNTGSDVLQPPTNTDFLGRVGSQQRPTTYNTSSPESLVMRCSSASEGFAENPALVE
jgi:hypothetical protein